MKIFLTLIAVTLLVAPAIADHHEGGQPATGEMPPMGKPAEMDALAYMLGEWNVEMKYKMDPAGEWVSTTGTASSAALLNGCVNRMDFESDVMGMPFKGFSLVTYNRETGMYDSMWVDDMSAKMSTMSGDFDDGAMVMLGTDIQQGMKFHSKTMEKKISDDEIHFSMYMSMDEGETWFENMQMIYKRK